MKKRLSRKFFCAKLLLFGEHIIHRGARGFALPLNQYGGCMRLKAEKVHELESNRSLELLANYIVYQDELCRRYDTNALLEDLENGLFFDSDIPQGYGLGSSGALVASVYYNYRKNRKTDISLTELKSELAALESYFHGKSSGLDATVSYLQKSVILVKGEVDEVFKFKQPPQPVFNIFLLNTRIARKTSPYVNMFLERCKSQAFYKMVEKSLVPANNIAIDAMLNRKYVAFWKSVKIISQLHIDMLPDFIPNTFHEYWTRGLNTNQYALKICGAGGGGFIIGFAPHDSDYRSLLAPNEIIDIMQV
ncbi:MAG: hypothetical protein NZM35_10865 [Chitinophagales bacterium]|nr:hypothetical protein [Chitinophagales bacterium]